jgi:hypothetical protein
MGGPTSSIRYCQHSSRDHLTTQAPPLRQSRDTFGGASNKYALNKGAGCNVSHILQLIWRRCPLLRLYKAKSWLMLPPSMPVTRTERSAIFCSLTVTKCYRIFTRNQQRHYISAVRLRSGLFVWFAFRLTTWLTEREHTCRSYISRTIYGTVSPTAR